MLITVHVVSVVYVARTRSELREYESQSNDQKKWVSTAMCCTPRALSAQLRLSDSADAKELVFEGSGSSMNIRIGSNPNASAELSGSLMNDSPKGRGGRISSNV